MDSITLNFNVNVSKLQEIGVDPTTSEGKATLKQFLLDYASDGVWAGESHKDKDRDHTILDAFLEEE